MSFRRSCCLVSLGMLLLGSPTLATQRWWAGGGVGLGFGDITYVSIEPMVGYSAAERLGVGGRLIYRYRDDERYSPSLSTSDYGASVFGRYAVAEPVFVQLEYEYLNYEFLRFDGSTDRDAFDSVFTGGGVLQPLGGNSSFFALALYNFSYDEDELSPYSDPWVIRVGVGFAF